MSPMADSASVTSTAAADVPLDSQPSPTVTGISDGFIKLLMYLPAMLVFSHSKHVF
jgi:hypothetical protein